MPIQKGMYTKMFKTHGGFKNFWYYNKLKIFGVVLLILFAVFAFSQCSGKVVTDLSILHVSEEREANGDMLLDSIKKDVNLIADSEEAKLEFIHVFVPPDPRDIMETGALEKIQVEMVSGKSTLFVLDEETVYSYKDDDFFYDLTDVADSLGITDENRYFGPNGEVCALLLECNSYLEANGINCEGQYIAIRNHTPEKSSEYKNAFSALNHILKKGNENE